jgi:hypothetical protein
MKPTVVFWHMDTMQTAVKKDMDPAFVGLQSSFALVRGPAIWVQKIRGDIP